MRLVIFRIPAAIALVAAGLATPVARAETPVTTQPLARGEVLLEVNAIGTVTSRGDTAILYAVATGSGRDEAEARGQVDQQIERLTSAAVAAGVRADDVQVRSAPHVGWMVSADMQGPQEAGTPSSSRSTLEVRVRDIARVGTVERALRDAGAAQVSPATYELLDDAPARRSARAQAIAVARADAEAYAQSLGMRVARIVRVTERVGFDVMSLFFGEPNLTRRLQARVNGEPGPDVTTQVIVGVDFALAPQ